MDFAEAWNALDVGNAVTVGNGTPPPSANTDGWPYKCWKSHNFTGTLIAKNEGPPRTMQIDQAADEAGTVVGYQVVEGVGHSFTVGE